MQHTVNNEDMVKYYIQTQCSQCKAPLCLETDDDGLAQKLKVNDRLFGPCPDCNAAVLRVVAI